MNRDELTQSAFTCNGTYFEDVVPGYHTINTRGRYLLEKGIELTDKERADGSLFSFSRYPAREIEVDYFIDADNWLEFQERYLILCQYLNVDNAQIIFNGEPDKYVIGSITAPAEVEEAQFSRSGTYKILCADPFKYSVTEYTETAAGGTFNVNYDGTYKSYPKLIAEFPATYDANGDQTDTSECGYIGYAKTNGAVLQFGDPEQTDWAEITPAEEPLNKQFKTLSGWNLNDAAMLSTNYVEAGNLGLSSLGSVYWTYPTAYGSNTKYHGPSIRHNLTDTTIDTDFEFEFGHEFAATKAQFGCFQALLYDSSNTLIAGANILKTTKDTKATVYVYGGSTTAKGSKPVKCANIGSSLIKKEGKKLTFYIGEKTQTITLDDTTAAKIVRKVVFYFGKKGTNTPIGSNKLFWCTLLRKPYVDVQNTFQPGDVLTVDTASADVYLDKGSATIPAPNLGALGNDWEEFYLAPGLNVIAADYSDFTTTPPKFTIKYRKRYI